MSAYIFVSVEVHDPVRYEDYRKTVLPTIEAYGGRFLVRGGKMEVLEGNWPARRIVIVEFPSAEIARKWWNSPGYAAPKALRQATSQTEMILVEGV
ncbi:MAG TPA: DUF1330 domain-containing protein [Candidatus Sulfotelmatobacter sp.]|jgi:uncharacterized protein (DUF1330 family)|nr:DUF1330 domain-containing protein [Candidatus Sulfotelmatobacter sp.]